MKPYEEIEFPNGFLRWIREDGEYVCRMTEEQMVEIKALHEAPRTWVKFGEEDMPKGDNPMFDHDYFIAGMVYAEMILKKKNA
jgi:hypothetical protein